MSMIDIAVLVLIVGGAIFGWLKGFVTEILSLFAWAAAIFALKMLHRPATDILTDMVGTRGGAAVLAFVLVFGVVFVVGRMIAHSLGRRTRQSVLGPIDRLLGLGFGALKGLLIATVLFLALNLLLDIWSGPRAVRPEWMRQSRFYPLLNASGRAIIDFVHMRQGDVKGHDSLIDNSERNGAV